MLHLIAWLAGVLQWLIANPDAGIPLAIVGRGAFVYIKPNRQCRWCRPGGLIGGSLPARLAGHEPGRRRKSGCWRCHGIRLTRRWGAYHMHKVKLALVQAWEERGER